MTRQYDAIKTFKSFCQDLHSEARSIFLLSKRERDGAVVELVSIQESAGSSATCMIIISMYNNSNKELIFLVLNPTFQEYKPICMCVYTCSRRSHLSTGETALHLYAHKYEQSH